MRVLAVTIFCLAASIAGADATATAAELPPARAFVLSYERGGGLAPSPHSLRVATGGRAIVETTGASGVKSRARFHLGGRRIRSLQRGLDRADLDSISPESGGCADCFVYSLTYEGSSVELEDTEVPPALEAVIGQIEAIITAHS
jgi:hypothetical protein